MICQRSSLGCDGVEGMVRSRSEVESVRLLPTVLIKDVFLCLTAPGVQVLIWIEVQIGLRLSSALLLRLLQFACVACTDLNPDNTSQAEHFVTLASFCCHLPTPHDHRFRIASVSLPFRRPAQPQQSFPKASRRTAHLSESNRC